LDADHCTAEKKKERLRRVPGEVEVGTTKKAIGNW